MREHASGGHGGCRVEIWPKGPLPWMSSGAIWWRGWRRPWHSWSRGEPDNSETMVANLAGEARRHQWRGSGTGQRGRAEQRYSSFLPARGEVASRVHDAADDSRRSASRPGRRGRASLRFARTPPWACTRTSLSRRAQPLLPYHRLHWGV